MFTMKSVLENGTTFQKISVNDQGIGTLKAVQGMSYIVVGHEYLGPMLIGKAISLLISISKQDNPIIQPT